MKVRVKNPDGEDEFEVYYYISDDENGKTIEICLYPSDSKPKYSCKYMSFNIVVKKIKVLDSEKDYFYLDFSSDYYDRVEDIIRELDIVRKILLAFRRKMDKLDGPCLLTKMLSVLKQLGIKPLPK